MHKTIILMSLCVLLIGCNRVTSTESDNQLNLGYDSNNQNIDNTQIMDNSNNSSPSAEVQQLLNISDEQQIFATLNTSMGKIKIELYPQKAPVTVANFVGLSEGTKPWTDPKTGQTVSSQPLYKDLIFHRVIKDFMVQGGDPLGTGTGGPGYKFQDETQNELTFDSPGILAMANAGPNTNGSQFFITHAATPWLNGRHTIFGKVVEGMDVVDKIATTPTGQGDKPLEEVKLESISIERK